MTDGLPIPVLRRGGAVAEMIVLAASEIGQSRMAARPFRSGRRESFFEDKMDWIMWRLASKDRYLLKRAHLPVSVRPQFGGKSVRIYQAKV